MKESSPLHNAVSRFDPISLSEMESVKLMDRVDTKYVFNAGHLPFILENMTDDYRLLEINNVRMHRYESLYYDTGELALYRKHQSGRLNRHKIRFRKYLDSGGLTFFEIKFKNNKERTIKQRVKVKSIEDGITGKAGDFLKSETFFSPEIFSSVLWVNYARMTFVNKFSQERLTIDTNLQFIHARQEGGLSVAFPHIVIAEAKRDKASSVSKFIRLVRTTGVCESGISKYCFGIFNLYEEAKKNNFKPRVRFIHKMANTSFS